MTAKKSDLLRVPGASLSYTIRGSGPLLLLIAGGGGVGESFEQVASHLAEWYTVVTYDRRGIAGSSLDDQHEEVYLEMQSNDAYRILMHLSSEPAYVFGSSAGALIGLDLVAHHSKQVHSLVAHEPPARYLLPAPDPEHGQLLETYHSEGAASALRQFAIQIGVNYQNVEARVNIPQWREVDAEAFFKYTFPAVQHYRLDIPALQAASSSIVIAGGSAGRAYLGYLCAVAVAKALGATVVEFPGHHAGFISHPRAFAEKLHAVFGEAHLL
ncbi:alpha/beta hydrolase [Reticulibacter mediterranei]|uniref:Alpha/beta hydrolase n=1 Tax=Reticulibacter mediterranei TaxID=2778369 RepID=A0A8J3N256_9CHLR|nr:alpha/beta hydrolase [Reticulibacter mediterranei]GHO95092.1 alpha/beta hydrolase [Reticulibacter mediterranei]